MYAQQDMLPFRKLMISRLKMKKEDWKLSILQFHTRLTFFVLRLWHDDLCLPLTCETLHTSSHRPYTRDQSASCGTSGVSYNSRSRQTGRFSHRIHRHVYICPPPGACHSSSCTWMYVRTPCSICQLSYWHWHNLSSDHLLELYIFLPLNAYHNSFDT